MISQKMDRELSKQLNKEFHSAYLYLGMSAWCAEAGFSGSAGWFMAQYQEEQEHGMKVYNYLLDQGGKVELLKIKKVKTEYKSLLACFEASLEHEMMMTTSFNELCDFAMKEKDHASYGFFQWFVEEQIEEEATVSDIISKLKMVGDKNGVFMIDNRLTGRTVTDGAQD